MTDFFPVLGLTRADVEACRITGSGLNTINPTDEEMGMSVIKACQAHRSKTGGGE